LSIFTMILHSCEGGSVKHTFANNTTVTIDPASPNTVRSSIDVAGVQGMLRDVNVTVDVEHTYANDLAIALIGPNGQRTFLVVDAGGSGDNFAETTFDDQATAPITGAPAPFRGSFRPEGRLAVFNELEPNGTWTLEIQDKAFEDGGALQHWSLEIDTDTSAHNGPFVFHNGNPHTIDAGLPNTVRSSLEVTDLDGLVIDTLNVTLDIDHTYTDDLTIMLISPDNQGVVLVDREGGSQNNFDETTFDDAAAVSITDATAPFRGRFRPEGRLSGFAGRPANGIWTLQIRDNASRDGGILHHWSLALTSRDAAPRPQSAFSIRVRFLGGLSTTQQAVFEQAAARWAAIITGDLPNISTDVGVVDDVVIDAEGKLIDGQGNVLGQAGPIRLRPGTLLPARGIMSFDVADLARMEADGSLLHVIIHEMGHVLGLGTLWESLGLLQGAGTANPVFTGANAMREYAALIGVNVPTPVPVANTGGPGTRDGHWRESVFGNELMTGFLDAGTNPISRMTIAALQDMGYEVNLNAADPYALPTALQLAAMGIGVEGAPAHRHCHMTRPECEVLPESALV
jgi:subtilisin-like proprotein convertase family protein